MEASILLEEPNKLLMDLLIKNVSRSTPLNDDEKALLLNFKGRLVNKDEWKECLRLAREEKSRRVRFNTQPQIDDNHENKAADVEVDVETETEIGIQVNPKKRLESSSGGAKVGGVELHRTLSSQQDASDSSSDASDSKSASISTSTPVSAQYISAPAIKRANSTAYAQGEPIYSKDASNGSGSAGGTGQLGGIQQEQEYRQGQGKVEKGNETKRGKECVVGEHTGVIASNSVGMAASLKTAQDLTRSNFLRTEAALAASRFLMTSVGNNEGSEEDHESNVKHWLSALSLVTSSLEKSQQTMEILCTRISSAIAEAEQQTSTAAAADSEEERGRPKYTGAATHSRPINHAPDGSYDDRGVDQRYRLRSSSPPIRGRSTPSFGRSSSPSIVPESVVVDGHRYQISDKASVRRSRSGSAGRRAGSVQYGAAANAPLPESFSAGPLLTKVCIRLANPTTVKSKSDGGSSSRSSAENKERLQISRHDQPLYVNSEGRSVEVVWRESKAGVTTDKATTSESLYGTGHTLGDAISKHDRDRAHKSLPQDRRSLRREKFAFDAIFSSVAAQPGGLGIEPEVENDIASAVTMSGSSSNCAPPGALDSHACRLARKALYKGTDLVHVAMACGDQRDHASSLEPPLALFLGEAGGHGIVHHTIAEAISFYTPVEDYEEDGNTRESRGLFGRDDATQTHFEGLNQTPSVKNTSQYTATALKRRPPASSRSGISRTAANLVVSASSFVPDMTVSAVLVCNGMMSDLLNTSPADVLATFSSVPGNEAMSAGSAHSACHLKTHSNGTTFLANASNVRVRSLADYERLVGVLLGRRAATKEVLPLLLRELKLKRERREQTKRKILARRMRHRQRHARNTNLDDVSSSENSPSSVTSSMEEESESEEEYDNDNDVWNETAAATSSALAAWLIGDYPASLLLTVTVKHAGGESSTTQVNTDGYTSTPGVRGSKFTTPHGNRPSGRSERNSRFFFVCPYGDKWANPGPDLHALIEALTWPTQLERPPSLFVDNPVAALILNVDMTANSSGAILMHTADKKIMREKERLRMATALSSAIKGTTPGKNGRFHTSLRGNYGSSSVGGSRINGVRPDVNIIVGVSDLRSRKAAIHAAGSDTGDREGHLAMITKNALHVLRLTSLLDTTREHEQ